MQSAPTRGSPRKVTNMPKGRAKKDAKPKKVKKAAKKTKKPKKPTNFEFFYNRTMFRYMFDFLKKQHKAIYDANPDMSKSNFT